MFLRIFLLSLITMLIQECNYKNVSNPVNPIRSRDEIPIRVEFGGQKYVIPSNYFAFPLQIVGEDADFHIVRGVDLAGVVLDFTPRPPQENITDFNVRTLGETINVITLDTIPPDGRAAELRIMNHRLQHGVIIQQTSNAQEIHRIYRAKDHAYWMSELNDIYINDHDSSFEVCYDTQPGHLHGSCIDYVGYQNIVIQISYDSKHATKRQELRKTILDHFNMWQQSTGK